MFRLLMLPFLLLRAILKVIAAIILLPIVLLARAPRGIECGHHRQAGIAELEVGPGQRREHRRAGAVAQFRDAGHGFETCQRSLRTLFKEIPLGQQDLRSMQPAEVAGLVRQRKMLLQRRRAFIPLTPAHPHRAQAKQRNHGIGAGS